METIIIHRTKIYPRPTRHVAWHWVYDCTGPDGARFDNDSIVTLRDVLRRRYGRAVKLVEPWKI